jgi:ataxia telangiectasia mutated family protein
MRFTDIFNKLKAKRKECNNREETMLAIFLDIRSRFKPVMRHYFTERHKIPISWFTMRLNYTRSVATTSIVGHVLGLGDRHTSNILMDNVTGEVIHIDLGVAFDQVSDFLDV